MFPQVPTDSLPTGPGPPGLLPGLSVNTSGQYMVFTGCRISRFNKSTDAYGEVGTSALILLYHGCRDLWQ